MKPWAAIYRRELAAYFHSPIAYVLLAGYLAVTGFFFYTGVLQYAQLSLQAMQNPMLASLNLHEMLVGPLLGNQTVIMMFLVPLLTMRLLAEEKRTGTIELLLSYPLSDAQVVLAKFAAAWSVAAIMALLTGAQYLLLGSVTQLHWPAIGAGYLGLLLMLGAYAALGLTASALTENQIVAAFIGFGAGMVLWVMGFLAPGGQPGLSTLLQGLSLGSHFAHFPGGLIDTADLAYFGLFIGFFLFASIRILEAKRWKG